jgi:uncharacterized protein
MKSVLAVVLVVVVAYMVGGLTYSQTVYVDEENIMDMPRMLMEPLSADVTKNPDMTQATVIVPAVDQNGNGVATRLDVQVVPGTGRALVNIDKLLFWVDTQNSMRTARGVAEDVIGINTSSYDIVYTITANASVVEGPSAGAALTVAIIAALQDRQVNPEVMITGTINPDGTIGPIGGVMEKAKAAKDIGAGIFLVPSGQSVEVSYEQIRYCERIGFADYCSIESIPIITEIASEVDIPVIEVADIAGAMEYFLADVVQE